MIDTLLCTKWQFSGTYCIKQKQFIKGCQLEQ
jgi:hypothetical protein